MVVELKVQYHRENFEGRDRLDMVVELNVQHFRENFEGRGMVVL